MTVHGSDNYHEHVSLNRCVQDQLSSDCQGGEHPVRVSYSQFATVSSGLHDNATNGLQHVFAHSMSEALHSKANFARYIAARGRSSFHATTKPATVDRNALSLGKSCAPKYRTPALPRLFLHVRIRTTADAYLSIAMYGPRLSKSAVSTDGGSNKDCAQHNAELCSQQGYIEETPPLRQYYCCIIKVG
jgi:hypothetical protein